MELDQVDLKIIEALTRDSRTPFTKIADELGLSETAIRKRVRRLREAEVIRRFTIEVDYSKIGIRVIFVGVDVKPEKYGDVCRKLRGIRFIKRLYVTVGNYDMLAEAWVRACEEDVKTLLDEIERIEGVHKVHYAVIANVLK